MNELRDELKNAKCVECRSDAPGVTDEEIAAFHAQVPGWEVLQIGGEPRLQREYSFPDFQAALNFTNQLGAIAEAENHHPAITTEYGKVTVGWWTHSIKNIHRNDLIMAAKTDKLFEAKSQ